MEWATDVQLATAGNRVTALEHAGDLENGNGAGTSDLLRPAGTTTSPKHAADWVLIGKPGAPYAGASRDRHARVERTSSSYGGGDLEARVLRERAPRPSGDRTSLHISQLVRHRVAGPRRRDTNSKRSAPRI